MVTKKMLQKNYFVREKNSFDHIFLLQQECGDVKQIVSQISSDNSDIS